MRSPVRRLLSTTTGAAAFQLLRMSSSTSSPAPPPTRIAVVGAGIGGLTCAQTLLELAPPGLAQRLQVTLLEKSTSHGRCATREVAPPPPLGLTFNHGAPGFGAATPAFRRQVEAWVGQGVAVPFPGRAGYFRGEPTMRALPLHLAQGLDVRRPVLIERVARSERGGGMWTLYPQQQRAGAEQQQQQPSWEADALVVAVPPEQSAALLEGVAGAEALHAAIAGVKSEPCITVMLAVPAAAAGKEKEEDEEMVVSPAGGGADGVLAKAVRRRRGGHDCWVAHTTRAFSKKYIYTSKEAFEKQAVVDAVLAAMRAAGLVAPGAAPTYAGAQRWLYSQTNSPVAGAACGWDPRLRLGLCGDGWAGVGKGEAEGLEGVERAWLSGRALGEAMAREWWGGK